MYADIVVDISAGELDRVFEYHIPDELLDKAVVGARVSIPFGKGNRMIEGYIIDLKSDVQFDKTRIKNIQTVLDDGISAERQLITLASNMKTVYGSTMLHALKTVIPVSRQVRPLYRKYYKLHVSGDALQAQIAHCRRDKRLAGRLRMLEYLSENEQISREAAVQGLNVSTAAIKSMVTAELIEEIQEKHYRRAVRPQTEAALHVTLNEEQQSAVKDILAAPGDVHLLHGITGSGKTEVYIELIDAMLQQQKQVIVLIPEISLTMQTVSRFYRRFGDRISVMNSRLSAGERYDQFMRAKEGDVDVIVGPRSALFMPFERLGLIIIDEEHDGAYKSESTPKYHARDVAVWRSRLCGATVVLGSATPSVVSYKKAKDGIYHLHTLTQRAKEGSCLPHVTVVDLRQEFKLKNKKIFSQPLITLMNERLEKKEQTMLFLNRRGFAGFLSCRNCGYVVKCVHCDVSMTVHYDGRLKCHYCGYEQSMPKQCPSCGSPYIAAFGTGTQKVENMVMEQFPQARVLRLDRDAASKKEGADEILSEFKSETADILVGTQMIVKGHDFPKVTLVGALAADLSMFSGDYMASERTFDLLVQAAGRAGRAGLPGEVVIQTYNPEHYCIQAAARQDYEAFYAQEILYRQMMHYPPFYSILAILGEAADEAKLEIAMKTLAEVIKQAETQKNAMTQEHTTGITDADRHKKDVGKLEIIGPANAFVARGKDAYRKVIYVKCQKQRPLILLKNQLEIIVQQRPDFKKIYIQYDMDPINMY